MKYDTYNYNRLIKYIKEESEIKFGQELANKINILNQILISNNEKISIHSIRSFISFMENLYLHSCPSLALSPDNEIYAKWNVTPDRWFSVVFLENGAIRLVSSFEI